MTQIITLVALCDSMTHYTYFNMLILKSYMSKTPKITLSGVVACT